MKNSTIILIIAIVVVAGGFLYLNGFFEPVVPDNGSSSDKDYDAFAQCLTDSGATFYGAEWCPHCNEQKNEFGKSMKLVNYVECSLPNRGGQTTVCHEAGITGYPTWEFADGERISGKLSFSKLSEKTGCELP